MGRTRVHVDEFESIDSWPHLKLFARPPLPCPPSLSLSLFCLPLRIVNQFACSFWATSVVCCHPHDMTRQKLNHFGIIPDVAEVPMAHAGPPRVPFSLAPLFWRDPNRFKLCHTLARTRPGIAPCFYCVGVNRFLWTPGTIAIFIIELINGERVSSFIIFPDSALVNGQDAPQRGYVGGKFSWNYWSIALKLDDSILRNCFKD